MPENRSPFSRIVARRQRRSSAEPALATCTRQREFVAVNWGELLAQAKSFGLGLCALGIQRGDSVGIVAANGSESAVAILGAMFIGAVMADLGDGGDLAFSANLLELANCQLVICGERDHAEGLMSAVRQHCGERGLIGWGAASSINGVLPFGQVCLKGVELADREPVRCSDHIAAVANEDVAVLLVDSRRDRTMQQVRLTHDNCIVSAESLRKALGIDQQDRIVALGASKTLVDQVLMALLALLTGASLAFDTGELSPSVVTQIAHGTVIFADGSSLDAMQRELERELLVGASWRRLLGRWALRVGNEAARRHISGAEMGPFLAASRILADRLVLSEQRRLLGGQVRRLIVPATDVRRATRWFFESIGVSPLGLTGVPESGGIGLIEMPDDPRPGSYGRGMPGVDVWIDAEGRVRIRGANVARQTTTVDARGWLDLGIVGEIDDEGTIWPERALGALDAPSLAMLPIAEQAQQPP